MKERVQAFGGFMAGMVIPNIGAILAWGLITAFFIPTGWLPNGDLAKLVGPMITWLLPLLIGYTGGRAIYGHRGGVVGAIVTAGIIVGSTVPQFLGGMIAGPIGAFVIKKFDQYTEERIPSGFEMLVQNFSAGILGALMSILGFYWIGPVLTWCSDRLGDFVSWLVSTGLLPIADIPIEVGKVLFLNNAINHGVLAPLGAAEAAQSGKAIHFLLETNPGPGLGLLLAFMVAGKGMAKMSAPGAAIIHFFGGIHEVYFPYVLMKPIMLLAVWAGGISADMIFTIFRAGLVATPSPGSIFAYLAVIPPGQHIGVLLGVLTGTVVTFAVGTLLLKLSPMEEEDEEPAAINVAGLAAPA
jgi:mannitol PTS system EIICBA or EIICB component